MEEEPKVQQQQPVLGQRIPVLSVRICGIGLTENRPWFWDVPKWKTGKPETHRIMNKTMA